MLSVVTSVETTARPTERIVSFSDALFAIAITFLALDLAEVPESVINHEETVTSFLSSHIDDFMVYAGTFLIVGFLWSRHHRIFRYVKERVPRLTWLNLLLLALVALLPYPAGIVRWGLGSGLALACLLVPFLVIALLLVAIWETALAKKLVIPEMPEGTRAYFRASLWSTVAVLGLALALALVSWKLDSRELCDVAALCGVLLIILPPLVHRRWPIPPQAIYRVPNAEAFVKAERAEAGFVLTSLEKIRNGSDLQRLTVFTDGVFAIAVTILALQLHAPDSSTPVSNQALIENIQSVPWIPYLSTFAFIGVYWVTHVRAFESIIGADSILIWLNIIFLLFVAVLPLPMELVSRLQGDIPSLLFYLSILCLVSICLAAMRIYTVKTHELSKERIDSARSRMAIARSIWVCAAFALGIALVAIFDNVWFSNIVLLLVLLRGPILRRAYPDAPAEV